MIIQRLLKKREKAEARKQAQAADLNPAISDYDDEVTTQLTLSCSKLLNVGSHFIVVLYSSSLYIYIGVAYLH